MGMGGQSQTTSETKEIKLPPWVDAASQGNYKFAEEIAGRPYQAYQGPTVAKLGRNFDRANALQYSLDDSQPYYDNAQRGLQGVMAYNPTNYNPSTVSAMMLPQMDRAAYMNPITDAVEARAIENAKQTGLQAQTALASKATKSGGLGGSRDAVQRAVQGAETTRGIGDLSAELRSKAYDTATQSMMSDAARKLSADTQTGEWSQQAKSEYEKNKLAANQQDIAAAAQMTETAGAQQQARMNQIATLLGLGNIRQQQTQREYDERARKWQERYDYPLEQLNIRLAALGMSPYGHTETGTSTTKSSGGGGAGQAIGIGAQLLSMFSDAGAKTNIEVIDDEGPIPIVAYDYKDDVRRAKKSKKPMGPKRVGVLAQDVERAMPHLVRKVGKRRVIDLTELRV